MNFDLSHLLALFEGTGFFLLMLFVASKIIDIYNIKYHPEEYIYRVVRKIDNHGIDLLKKVDKEKGKALEKRLVKILDKLKEIILDLE